MKIKSMDGKNLPRCKKITTHKKYTLTSITYALCGVIMFGILMLTVITSVQIEGFLKQELRLRIGDAVKLMAGQIDSNLHTQVQTLEDDQGAVYLKLKKDMWDMRERGTEIANAYTMRKKENGDIVFIVDGSATAQNATGDVYPSEQVTTTFASIFNATPETIQNYIEPDIYTDDWGVWLSAYAPIFTPSGKLDGIVGIDVSAKSIRQHQMEYLATILFASLFVIALTLPFVFRLMNFIRATTAELEQANKDFKRLLDNSGQGFLSFGKDLIIDGKYSHACEVMLGQSPAGKNAADVFFQNDASAADLFNMIISSVLNETEEFVRENMLSLLPVEIQYDGAVLNAEYKMLENDKFMVILTDITQERRMAEALKKERLNLELIVVAVSDSRNFFDIVEAFREFLTQGLPNMLHELVTPKTLVKELYREVHTYKGLLNQFSFPNTPKILHEVESSLSELLELGDALTIEKITAVISADEFKISFDKDLAIISNALGTEFLANGKSIVLTCEQALEMEKLATRLLRGEPIDTSITEIRTLLNKISTLCKVSFRDVLIGFSGLVEQSAARMGKEVAPLVVTSGENIWIDSDAYQPFLRSLVHVFRNTVVHGIESPEVRWEAEKDTLGKITCQVNEAGNVITLTISDDGAGINLDALRERVVTAGIYTAAEVAEISDDEVAKFIFMDNISTEQEVSELAGRGVGMAAVLNETKNLGGEIVVKTVPKQGTEFLFTLPYLQ